MMVVCSLRIAHGLSDIRRYFSNNAAVVAAYTIFRPASWSSVARRSNQRLALFPDGLNGFQIWMPSIQKRLSYRPQHVLRGHELNADFRHSTDEIFDTP